MANLVCWHMTRLPCEIIDILEEDIKVFDTDIHASEISGGEVNEEIRNSKNSWIPTEHWIGGWLWYYIQNSNRQNFNYDIEDIDGGTVQYTHYSTGEFYNWHQDADIDICDSKDDYIRKLSFTLQLSDPTDYTGGEVEFLDNSDKRFFAPKQRGTMIIFDSRIRHRVRRIKSGTRKSIVGWCMGPRWK